MSTYNCRLSGYASHLVASNTAKHLIMGVHHNSSGSALNGLPLLADLQVNNYSWKCCTLMHAGQFVNVPPGIEVASH